MYSRFTKLTRFALILLVAGALLIACQPVQPEVAKAQDMNITESKVIDGAGPITATDPAQIQAEEEFRAAAIAKEQAYYDGDVERVLSYYADDVISVWPDMPEIVGKAGVAEGTKPFMENNHIVGELTIKRFWVNGDHATRFAEWEEVVTPNDGSAAEHHIGRCILNWEKIDGEWKVVSEFINYLEPPTLMQ